MMSSQNPLTLAVIFGGESVEHSVSVRSARAVLEAIDRDRFRPLPIGITRGGTWLRPVETEALLDQIANGAPECVVGPEGRGVLARPQVLEALAAADVAFPLIHGARGEDGSLQGFFELADLPYVGAGVAASAIGLDKSLMKLSFERADLPITTYQVVTREQWARDRSGVGATATAIGIPAFVKPANGGSSLGITKVHMAEEMGAAIDTALTFDHKVIIERGVSGRECECGVIGNDQEAAADDWATIRVTPVGEIRTPREFYDYVAKYDDDATELIVPADLPHAVSDEIRRIAREAFIAIGCAGMARVDCFLADDGAIWLNEINTIPGFTKASMFPRAWEADGLSFPSLVSHLVDLAIAQHEEQHHRES
jgi:D-alanine-D-alanine ligase